MGRGQWYERSKPWLAILPVLVSCGGLLGIDKPEEQALVPDPVTAGGSGGDDGLGGTANGGTAGTAPAGGGNGGAAGHSGADGAGGDSTASGGNGAGGGTASGGRGGAASGGRGGSDGGAPGGSAGDGGEEDPGIVPGAPCTELNAYSCTPLSPKIVLRCVDGEWWPEETCYSNEHCMPPDAMCVRIEDQCYLNVYPYESVCKWGDAWRCTEELNGVLVDHCPFGCADGECLPGNGDQLFVHLGSVSSGSGPWPNPIPVCFHDSSTAPDQSWQDIVLEEIEATYSRVTVVRFERYECDGRAGIEVSLIDDCRNRLANDLPYGLPGPVPAPEPLEICRTYYDFQGELKTTDEALLRYLARHQFGHVMQLRTEDSSWPETMMLRAIEAHKADELRLSPWDRQDLDTDGQGAVQEYLPPFSGSFVSSSGRCMVSPNDNPALTPCIDTPEQRWMLAAGAMSELASTEPRCLAATDPEDEEGSNAYTTTDCSSVSGQRIELAHAQWQGLANCVTADPTRQWMVTRRCPEYRDPDASWHVDIWDRRPNPYIRIRLADTNLCARAPANTEIKFGTPLTLGNCGDLEAEPTGDYRFYLNSRGMIRNDLISSYGRHYCILAALHTYHPYDYILHFEDCARYETGLWTFSGHLELTSPGGNQLVLTAGSPFRFEPLRIPTDPKQIFDYHPLAFSDDREE